jgi:hypothetical protein
MNKYNKESYRHLLLCSVNIHEVQHPHEEYGGCSAHRQKTSSSGVRWWCFGSDMQVGLADGAPAQELDPGLERRKRGRTRYSQKEREQSCGAHQMEFIAEIEEDNWIR